MIHSLLGATGFATLAVLLAGCGRALPPAPAYSGSLAIRAPGVVGVGEAVPIGLLAPSAPDGTTASLIADGSFGPRSYAATFRGGVAVVQVPGSETRQSGTLTLIARVGTTGATGTLTLEPDIPAEPITALVGARAIIADGRHWSMASVVPFDRFGNPVVDGTGVEIRVLHADDRLEDRRTAVAHGVAWSRIYSHTRAGRDSVVARTVGAHGPEAELLEVAGRPMPFGLRADLRDSPADGQHLVGLSTNPLRDRYGNMLPDGTLVTFGALLPDGTRESIPAYTVDGVAAVPLQAPERGGVTTIVASADGANSAPLALRFSPGPAVGHVPLTAHVDVAVGTLLLRAGPLLGPLGQYVPDGTAVLFGLHDGTGQTQISATEPSADGYASLSIQLIALPPGAYSARASGGSAQGSATFSIS